MAVDIKTLAVLSTQVYTNYKAATGDTKAVAVTSYGGFTRLQTSGVGELNTYYCEAWKNDVTKEVILVNRGTATLKDATTNVYIASELQGQVSHFP
jgi:hypothetical protein